MMKPQVEADTTRAMQSAAMKIYAAMTEQEKKTVLERAANNRNA